jgi:hypothetical protein
LCRAVREAEQGLIVLRISVRRSQAAYRIARPGQGKSGGFRTLIVFQAGIRAFFVHGFAKNEKDNVEKDELAALKKLASELLAYDDKTIARAVASGVLVEVACDEKNNTVAP